MVSVLLRFFFFFLNRIIPRISCSYAVGGGGSKKGYFRNCKRGFLEGKKKKRVSGEFLACLETARLIAVRFRFETGCRQHLENDSLRSSQRNCGLLLLRFMYLCLLQFPL